jgi:hypothetical protein
MADLEERTLESLPARCANCGATLTDAEKRLAIESGASPVLCSICATEQEPGVDELEDVGP